MGHYEELKMDRRKETQTEFRLDIWKQDCNLWYCNTLDLLAAIHKYNIPDWEQKRKMGIGFHLVQDALLEKRLNKFEVVFVEMGILPDFTYAGDSLTHR